MTGSVGSCGRPRAMCLVVIILATQAAALFIPDVLRPDLFDIDAPQHIWWTYRYSDPSLFPNDFTADFFSQPMMAPYGVQVLYRVLVPWVDAQVLSELLPFGLAVLTSILAWVIGRRAAGGDRAGGTVACVFAGCVLFRFLRGGIAHTFAPPILMLGVWALMARRHGWLGVSLVLAALLYPPIGLIVGLTAAVVLGMRVARERQVPPDWPWLIGPALIAVGIVVAVYAWPSPGEFGPRVTAGQARTMAEFGPVGRVKFFIGGPAVYLEGTRAGVGVNRYVFLAMIALIAVGAWKFPGTVPREAWAIAGVSVAAFATAHAALFALHVPNRYVVYTVPVFVMMCLAAWLPLIWTASQRGHWFGRRVTFLGRLSTWMAVAVVAGSTSVYGSWARRSSADLDSAYAFLRTLPTGTLVAAHPLDADAIPLRTQRSVLVSNALALPFYLGYYERVAERTVAVLAACYASSWTEVDALHERYGADVFLVNRDRYLDLETGAYFEPFRNAALNQIMRGRREGFVLDPPVSGRVLFAQGNYMVVRLGPGK